MAQYERSSVGSQMIIPGCERRTLPKSPSIANWNGQGLLEFYAEPTLGEKLELRAAAPMLPRQGQKPLPKSGLFSQRLT